jgi:hypothetical protein
MSALNYHTRRRETYDSAATCDIGARGTHSGENDASEAAVPNVLQNLESIL